MPTHFHAVIWIDHSQARIFHLGLSGSDEITLHPHLATRHLHHKANAIGSGHAAPDKAFYAEVTKALADAGEILPAETTHFYPKPPAGLVMRWLPAE